MVELYVSTICGEINAVAYVSQMLYCPDPNPRTLALDTCVVSQKGYAKGVCKSTEGHETPVHRMYGLC